MQRLKARLTRRSSSREKDNATSPPNEGSPEGIVNRGVKAFCESGGPNKAEDEVLHLPAIVDAAESSPLAAKEGATQIRKCLSKENYERPYVQYNAIMLVRILADNPGRTFTRCLDVRFTNTVKELLRTTRDPSVQQILRETLNSFETDKSDDEGLRPLLDMWLHEKAKPAAGTSQSGPSASRGLEDGPNNSRHSQNYFSRNHKNKALPAPDELAGRIEEAKTSASLLLQVVQSTPTSEVLNNDLIAEFAQRCQSASRSVQAYIHSDDPVPDDDTLLTLIETNEQLSLAMSKHQRAVLQARKLMAMRATSASPPVPILGGLAAEPDPFADERATTPLSQAGSSSTQPTRPPRPYDTPSPQPGSAEDAYHSEYYPPPLAPAPNFNQDVRPPNRDESFRLTLPPQAREPEPTEHPELPKAQEPELPKAQEPEDLRWSWSQRLSTQTGYGPGSSLSPADSRRPSAQDPRHPAFAKSQDRRSPGPNGGGAGSERSYGGAKRQESAVSRSTTVRGGPGLDQSELSPVSPLDRPAISNRF